MKTLEPDAVFRAHLVEPGETHLREIILAHESIERINAQLLNQVGVEQFFSSIEELEQARQFILLFSANASITDRREFGDFQTPLDLARRACRLLREMDVKPRVIIEPTCGVGNFVLAALENFPSAEKIYGVEIQKKYLWQLKMSLLTQTLNDEARSSQARIELHNEDIFNHCFPPSILEAEDILILGNPPWVTNSALSVLDSQNLPTKSNIKSLSGMDALTGKSNFDINEWILLEMLRCFSARRGTLAMLCKNSVIKNIIKDLPRRAWSVCDIQAFEINAAKEFKAATAASLLVLQLGATSMRAQCRVADLNTPQQTRRTFGWDGNYFVSDIENYQMHRGLDGKCPWTWRQGIKHDCAAVMELKQEGNLLINGSGQVVEAERDWLFPLLKGSELKGFEVTRSIRKLILTQRNLQKVNPQLQLEILAPQLWNYLNANRSAFENRKSRIYAGKPDFSIFGVGEYSFKPYKVAISGLYKNFRFCMVPPVDSRPVMLDDTCYFLGFDCYLDALFTNSILNSRPVQSLLKSLAFPDAMRMLTKEILMRINLYQAAKEVSFFDIIQIWKRESYAPRETVLSEDYKDYMSRLDALHNLSLPFNQSQMSLL